MENGLVGKYVIVRCRDAGVHAGVLEGNEDREAVLTNSRRLWYWKPQEGKFLSGVAQFGLALESKVGEAVSRIHLTETCEIIQCTEKASQNIKEIQSA